MRFMVVSAADLPDSPTQRAREIPARRFGSGKPSIRPKMPFSVNDLHHRVDISKGIDLRIETVDNQRLAPPQQSIRSARGGRLCKTSPGAVLLTKRRQEGVDKRVEIPVALAQRFDLADGMNHRRVVFAAEAPAYFWQRGIRQRLA